ncbi:46 kDa FK506-binding nuclear protein [Anopheles marshallii]|uniref:46 kDa FK506-binding nuclear protein n=1 Tax=Anopheles marshallii TaxID=1521116 RepID=UPI00237B59FA|nr:46 kDa FK506-binding nuclear protein [Anopheles marshallii]
MFWGLILKQGKKYSKVVEQDFHLTHAALDLTDSSGDVQVMLTTESITYLLCTLNKAIPQVVLDQAFATGDEISFATKGQGVVHLTGNVLPDEMDELDDEEDEMDEEEEEELVTANGKPRSAKQVAKAKVAKKIADGEVSEGSDEDDATFTESMLDDSAANGLDDDDDDDEEEDDDEQSDEEDDEDNEDGEEEEEEDDDDEEEEDDDDDEEEEDEQPKAKQAKLSNDAKPVNGNAKSAKEGPKKQEQQDQPKKGGVRTLQDGLTVEDLKVGTGPEAKPGKKIAVYYEGRLKSNNKVFDSTNKGPGLKFSLGRGEVIKGWDLGVAGMKVGGKRRIVVPHKLAYGTKGSPPVIPPCSTLLFEVELKKVF